MRIILGGGCFWCLDAVFRRVSEVEQVRSGYCGGAIEHPRYQQVCNGDTGHVEVVELTFSPNQLQHILNVFFAIHDPTTVDRQGNDVGSQYRSAIYCCEEGQKEIVDGFIAQLVQSQKFVRPIVTQVHPSPAPSFWEAEAYHQDYYARNSDQPYCQLVVAPKVAKLQHLGRIL